MKNLKNQRVKNQSRLVHTNKTFCPECNRIIPLEIKEKNGFIYAEKNCPFEEKRFSELMFKGEDFSVLNIYKDKLPGYFPHVSKSLPIGALKNNPNEIEEFKIKNIHNISFLLLFLTKNCNANCSICVDKSRKKIGEMDFSHIKNIASQFRSKPFLLFGGEPTVREDLPKIINRIKKSGNIPEVFTNGIKLSNRQYLKELIDNGLEFVFLSLDSLDAEICRKIRNMPEPLLEIKKQALRNIIKENIGFSLETTLIKSLNDGKSLEDLVSFAAEQNNCKYMTLRSLSLCEQKEWSGFSTEQMFSIEEIAMRISKIAGVNGNYFKSWDDFKLGFAKRFKDTPFVKIPLFSKSIAYFKKENGKITPLIDIATLSYWTKILNQHKIPNIINKKSADLFHALLRSLISKRPAEFELDRNIIRIKIAHIGSPSTVKFNEGDYINSLMYYPDIEIVRGTPACEAEETA